MERDNEIINLVLSKTHINVYKMCMSNFNIQRLYEGRKNEILHKYFDGNQMKYSIEMARIFRRFGTTEELLRLNDLKDRLNSLKQEIKRTKIFKTANYETTVKALILEHNQLADEFNEIQSRTIEPLRKIYNNILKQKK